MRNGSPPRDAPRERWSGRTGFVLAAIGSAVGLGSIWKFPYEVGSNGGAAFLLFYALGLVLVVLPLMLAEFAIGRRGGGDAQASLSRLAAAHGASRAWGLAGSAGVLAGALILSFYSVIGGWTLDYALGTAAGGLPATAAGVRERYEALLASPLRMAFWHAAFLAIAGLIVARGVGRGIEAACKVLMPVLAVLMLALTAYSIAHGDLRAAAAFLFRVEPAAFTPRAALEALGLGFFSIGVAMGLMITYAAYAKPDIDLTQAALVSVAFDTAISLLAGLAVFPVVFAHGLDPASGPGLVLVTLPLAFARMPLGTLAAVAFFVLLFVAALASAISMLELVVAYAIRRWRMSRPAASAAAGAACFVAGLGTVLSFNLWAGWRPGVYEALDQLTSNVLLPATGLAIAIFAGWCLPRALLAAELGLGPRGGAVLAAMLRWVAPALILAAALASVF